MCFTEIFFGTARKDPNEKWLSRKHIIEGTKASCKRFGFDYVDVVYAHRPDVNTPTEEIVRAFNWVIEHGYACVSVTASKILMLTSKENQVLLGSFRVVSSTDPGSIFDCREAASHWTCHGGMLVFPDDLGKNWLMRGIPSQQSQYNLFHREKVEVEFRYLQKQYGLGNTIFSPLALGLLTGKYNDGVPEGSRLHNHKDFLSGAADELSTETGKAKIEKVKKLTKLCVLSVAHLLRYFLLNEPAFLTAIN
jgi:aryl-alcohol dehydrogenase-like predicted oxidoreductase